MLAQVAVEGGLHGSTELVEGGVFWLLGRGAELLSEITKDFILEC